MHDRIMRRVPHAPQPVLWDDIGKRLLVIAWMAFVVTIAVALS